MDTGKALGVAISDSVCPTYIFPCLYHLWPGEQQDLPTQYVRQQNAGVSMCSPNLVKMNAGPHSSVF